eukprot:990397-Pleurochrysis_carterae.AAC.2
MGRGESSVCLLQVPRLQQGVEVSVECAQHVRLGACTRTQRGQADSRGGTPRKWSPTPAEPSLRTYCRGPDADLLHLKARHVHEQCATEMLPMTREGQYKRNRVLTSALASRGGAPASASRSSWYVHEGSCCSSTLCKLFSILRRSGRRSCAQRGAGEGGAPRCAKPVGSASLFMVSMKQRNLIACRHTASQHV